MTAGQVAVEFSMKIYVPIAVNFNMLAFPFLAVSSHFILSTVLVY